MTKVLTTRVDKETASRIHEATSKSRMDKSAFLRNLLEKGLREFEQEDALKQYQHGEISLGKLCDVLGITKWDGLDLLQMKQISLQYSEDDLTEDIGRSL